MNARYLSVWLRGFVVTGLIASSSVVAAQAAQIAAPRTGEGNLASKRAHRDAVTAYAEGRYAEALRLFLEANHSRPGPAASYNVARAYEALGDRAQAVRWYRDYLSRAQQAPDAKRVQRRINRLQAKQRAEGSRQEPLASTADSGALLAKAAAASPSSSSESLAAGSDKLELPAAGDDEAVPADPSCSAEPSAAAWTASSDELVAEVAPSALLAPPALVFEPKLAVHADESREPAAARAARHSGGAAKVVGIATVVTGLAALGGALTVELLRRSTESRARVEARQVQYVLDLDLMHSQLMAERVLAGVGAALTVTGAVVLLLSPGSTEREKPRGLAFGCGGGGCGVSLRGRY